MGNDKMEQSGLAVNRRQFLKIGSVGAALGTVSALDPVGSAKAENASKEAKKPEISVHDDFPNEIGKDYQPPRNYDNIFGSGFFGRPLKAAGKKVDEEVMKKGDKFLRDVNYGFHKDQKGEDQLGRALMGGAWALSNMTVGPSPGAISQYGLFSWAQPKDKPPYALMEHNFLQKERFQFKSKKEAADAIKRAARLYGASLVGIARRDKRWDYREFFNPVPPMGRQMFPPPPDPKSIPKIMEMMKQWGPDKFFTGWESFPFEPKTVIVLGLEMDYEALSGSPNLIAAAGVGEGYSRMAKIAYQVSVFMKQLGYKAVPCGNDTGLSVPYAISAGLGEGSRAGILVTYNYGPRVRLAKIYTEFDFVEYDKPKTFGVMSFCANCRRCADACPGKAITKDPEPSFGPTHENKDNAYFNAKGTKKYYVNARKCFFFWAKNGDCANCITVCPYNKPDYWHHRMVRRMGQVKIGPFHDFLREMDIVFGYGNTFDKSSVDRFFANRADREYAGGL